MASILLIEDDLPSRNVYQAVLEKAGHDVAVAANGETLKRTHFQTNVDLVVTDIVMEDVDGIETVMGIKSGNKSTSVLAISGTDLYLENAKIFSADSTLLKPFDMKEFLAAVDYVLEQNSANR